MLETIKIIAIASGKGGVGKSTTATNLAIALSRQGFRVGILDADIYGPNQPAMLGTQATPEEVLKTKPFKPIERYGLQTMSMAYLVNANTPMVWRGPMVSSALTQLAFETDWQDLDYLLVDLPPGTGDIQLTLSKKIPLAGAVIVTTPQPIALLDARKGLEMFRKVAVPLLGIVENMSVFTCPSCHEQTAIFGAAGAEALAQETGVPLLGKMPLNMHLREAMDVGSPPTVSDPEGDIAQGYFAMAEKLLEQLSQVSPKTQGKFPPIVVEHTKNK